MEHEVVVPLPAAVVQQALQDPALLARCVPGLSTDTATGDGQESTGRLRVRIGTSTITYRGLLSLIPGREGVLTAFAEGEEVRGSGEATATVRLALAAGDAGDEDSSSILRFTCDLSATGRLTEFDTATLAVAGRRLLDRFGAALAAEAGDAEPPTATVVYLEDHAAANFGGDLDDDLADLISFSDDDLPGGPEATGGADASDSPDTADDLPELTGFPELSEVPKIPDSPGDLGYGLRPDPAATDPMLEGPVRRSIVGRSAEEVDHAPPRGRYAPALPARSARARAATRWGGTEAGPVVGGPLSDRSAMPWVIGGGVALLGGAVVLVRALRRR
ncbi:hypothetical protein [Kitasatospora sp. MAP5-34]|uniref:hypothetical protein n=1 Tax=Kitasatospora sp. MAP5-34 TaxID=3035102 RepID=UPI0024757642|nr:hypothetical protein [Kitasatospora sp. MAP5-34]MDH6580344.1 carbon monoxide dehydrogenase subunit G [Kitasatospora sp. MAP5-34]